MSDRDDLWVQIRPEMGDVGPGWFRGVVDDIEKVPSRYGMQYRCDIRPVDRELKRRYMWFYCNVMKGAKSGNIVEGLLGRPLHDGEDMCLEDFIGNEYEFFVKSSPKSPRGNITKVRKLEDTPAVAEPGDGMRDATQTRLPLTEEDLPVWTGDECLDNRGDNNERGEAV